MCKTIVYVDGYNLYYSRLQGGPFKWLDLVVLFERILKAQNAQSELIQLKYFTAPVKAAYARHGVDSDIAQTQYLRALQAKHGSRIEVIKGFHVFEPNRLPTYLEGVAANKADKTKVWMIEEKQTDVNIALHIYRDAAQKQTDQVLICSNDSDLEPALQLVKLDMPNVTIGLVLPLTPQKEDAPHRRISNKRLTPLAHWTRHHIRDEELLAAQLPTSVPTKKKPALKPLHW